jgi:hypothetical protein
MNSIWLKIAGVAVLAIVVLVVVGRLNSNKPATPKPVEKDKTFYDTVEHDKQYNEEPKPVAEPSAGEPAPVPAAEQTPVPPAPAPAQPPRELTPAQALRQKPAGVVYPSDLKGVTTLYFRPMSEEDDIQAQQILPYATAGLSIGRLPGPQYGMMMRAIEQIEQRWPDSWYCFRAKQMMEEITQYQDRYAMMYHITPQRLDISKFMKPGPGTQPREVRPIR